MLPRRQKAGLRHDRRRRPAGLVATREQVARALVGGMTLMPPGFIAPCLPTSAPQPPCGKQWLHEIKHDGFRLIARKHGNQRVTLFSRAGKDLAYRFPLIVEALSYLRV